MSGRSRRLARSVFTVLAVLAGAWAAVIWITGGFVVELGSVRISSRTPRNAVLAALVCAAIATLLRLQGARTNEGDGDSGSAAAGLPFARLRPAVGRLLIPSLLVAVAAIAIDAAQWLRGAPLWVDEQMIALNLRDRGFSELGGTLWLGQSAPFGWLVVQRAFLVAIGTSELALRLLSLLFGAATVIAAAWVGGRWMARIPAAVLVLLCALSQWLSHFRFELKHYAADAFFALLIPALGAWALHREKGSEPRQRWIVWWTVAAAGHWFANGALFVTPACAAVLVAFVWRRYGRAAAVRCALGGVIWAVSFAAHYLVAIQYTHHNAYLRSYWADAVPPAASGVVERVQWVAERLPRLADNPGASSLSLMLWICAAAGLMASRDRVLAAMCAVVPLSAFALAMLGFVPLYERFSVWIVPALLVGVALLLDRGWRDALDGFRARRPVLLVLGVALVVAAAAVSAEMIRRGARHLDLGAPKNSNHGLDDRRAVPWLMERLRPGDALMTTRLGWPAIWWYGQIPLSRSAPGGRLPNGAVMYQVADQRPAPGCDDPLAGVLANHERVLLYVGFPDMPARFIDLVLYNAERHASVTQLRRFGDLGIAAVLERRHQPPGELPPPQPYTRPAAVPGVPELAGCLGIATARRW